LTIFGVVYALPIGCRRRLVTGGTFNATQTTSGQVDNLITWNVTAPRRLHHDLTQRQDRGESQPVVWWNPGTTSIDSLVNPNSPDWWRRYTWTDTNKDGVWQNGEQGAAPTSSNGGVGSTQLDPNLQDTRTREAAFWLEREVAANFGVHAGFVWRKIDQLYQSDNLNRPVSAFNVPITVPRSRAGRHADGDGNADSGVEPESSQPRPADRELPAQHTREGRFLQRRAQRDQAHEQQVVAQRVLCVSVEPGQRHRLFRQHTARQAGRGESERRHQHR
jgi:hypothetical protein